MMTTISGFRKAFAGLTSHGWLTLEEALCLVDYAERTKGPIVEVGCYQGRSAMLLASLGRPLICVDPWDDNFSTDYSGDEIFRRFQRNMDAVGVANYTTARMRVEDWQPVPAGFVYLDGDHTYEGTRAQVEKALECKPTAIAIHDVNDGGEGADVKRAAVEILGDWCERVGKIAVWEMGQ